MTAAPPPSETKGAADLARRLGIAFTDHIAAVRVRVGRAAGDDPLAPALRLTALVHEEPPSRVAGILRDAGFTAVAPLAKSLVAAFGAVWKVRDDAELHAFVIAHRACLGPLLLFEVAHEGDATPAMRAAACLATLDAQLDEWLRRLGRG